jgi:GMP synthase-like glutamine amidotransferase
LNKRPGTTNEDGVSGERPTFYVVQNTDSEYLGLIEDHLEGRDIGFTYLRPQRTGGKIPGTAHFAAGLAVLGGGPWGAIGPPPFPMLDAEVGLTRDAVARGKPVIGVGLGAQVLAIAAGGGAAPAPLAFTVGRARRVADDALAGLLPESFPIAVYMRDRPVPPKNACVLAVDEAGEPALFQVGERAFGFIGHPGIKSGIVEDLMMEFKDAPADCGPALDALRAAQREIENALVRIMAGFVKATNLMSGGGPKT